ncbi:MAG: RNA-binding transcriptional accessory protein [Deltaproteobacteria bacterium]|nr:RNA-binding transcriptional accessory protein [Deltaproteobacteria bacterium]
MENVHVEKIANELGFRTEQVAAVGNLLAEGGTVPFISRYRKEATGSLDEVAVAAIRDRQSQLEQLGARRDAILDSLDKHGHLTDERKAEVLAAETLSALEDLYLPFRPKRRTKATVAREKGLEPLAQLIFDQAGNNPDALAEMYIDPEKRVESTADALAGARDIIAEWVNEDADARARMRGLFLEKGVIKSTIATGMEASGGKYKDYFAWQEPVSSAPSHRILAMLRGEKEDVLNVALAPPEEDALALLTGRFIKGEGADTQQVGLAVQDSYRRLLSRSMETETRLAAKERADEAAIKVFADNLRQLLLAPPLGAARVMGIDPGFRTGCKVVCLDRQGKLLHHDTIFPHTSEKMSIAAQEKVRALCRRYDVEAIAIGNGTAGRETESFVKGLGIDKVRMLLVNESGASVYSASEVARNEFPDLDLTVRGAASIGRRLMDPLAELVKIDPKSIGVGQYQHDVDPQMLKKSLDDMVSSCVNAVGVDVNLASAQLLMYVSGLGPQLAKNIVAFRDENGPFASRQQLKKVPRLGPKAYEQSAGFLRIPGGRHPLDASAVHPESYHIAEAMAGDLKCSLQVLIADNTLRRRVVVDKYVSDAVGLPTLNDIMAELDKPGRDPRQDFEVFEFAEGVNKISDLTAGMKLPGIVTNVTAFGAFVDVGVHQDGLVHISQLANRFIKDPSKVVKVQQKVKVTVLDVDLKRDRISLSMKGPAEKSRTVSKAKQSQNKKPSVPRLPKRAPKKQAPKKVKRENVPFNNPFAELFKSGSKDSRGQGSE